MDTATAPLTGREWDALVEAGFLVGEPIELVGGRKRIMSPEYSPHAGTVRQLTEQLVLQLAGTDLEVSADHPVALSDLDRPEPDLVVLDRSPTSWYDGHPGPQAVHLVIEVSATSRRFDKGEKATRYALAAIPEYWVLDLVEQIAYVHRDAADGSWGSIERIPFGTTLRPRDVPVTVQLDELPWPVGEDGRPQTG